MLGQIRRALSKALDPEMRPGRGLSRLNRAILVAIWASILAGILETEPVLSDAHAAAFRAFELGLFVLFLAEYLARLWVAPLNPRVQSPLRYALMPASLFDLVVILTMIAPFFGLESTVLRLVRAMRLLRLARLGRFSAALRLLGDAISSRRLELGVSLLAALGLLLISSTLLYLVEGGVQPEAFGSIPRAMWWSVATLTTVGYGDSVPVTALGRICAAVTALTGIGVIAVPTGILAGAFTEALQRARQRREE